MSLFKRWILLLPMIALLPSCAYPNIPRAVPNVLLLNCEKYGYVRAGLRFYTLEKCEEAVVKLSKVHPDIVRVCIEGAVKGWDD